MLVTCFLSVLDYFILTSREGQARNIYVQVISV